MNQLVSVVVPIFKVEKYLSRCVDSILNQTYNNIEIILVDDGSPDNCGFIADNYKKKDIRVKVIHKDNGGLSDARNLGVRYVTGEYTLFVDSDDWLDKMMIEKLIQTAEKYEADVVQSAFYYAYDNYLLFDSRVYKKGDSPEFLNNKSLMTQLVINKSVKNFAWGKLYKTKLIKNIPFKKGVLFEDVYWAHEAMQQVEKFVCLNDPLYYYYQREDSIVANYSPKNLDIIKGLIERHGFIEKYYKDLTNESYKVLLITNLTHYIHLLKNRKKDKGGIYRKEIQRYIIKNYKSLKKAVALDKTLKMQLFLFRIHPYLNIFFLLFHKVLRKISIIPQPTGLERVEHN